MQEPIATREGCETCPGCAGGTTVGYGDRYPTTAAGRLVATALMLVGIALLGVVTPSSAAWIVAYRYPDTSPSDYERTTSSR